MSQPWLKELNGDSMKGWCRGCFLFSLFYFMFEIPEPFFFAFEVRFVYCRKSDHCESLLFCNQGAIHTNNWLLYWRKTTTKPNEVELIKNPEQITNNLNNNKADLRDIIFKKWSEKLQKNWIVMLKRAMINIFFLL